MARGRRTQFYFSHGQRQKQCHLEQTEVLPQSTCMIPEICAIPESKGPMIIRENSIEKKKLRILGQKDIRKYPYQL